MTKHLFEIGMLVCFGASWPFSIFKVWRSKTSAGRSFIFLWLVFTGYACGVAHKIINGFDGVMWLYAFNGLMVLTDILLCRRYRDRRHAAA